MKRGSREAKPHRSFGVEMAWSDYMTHEELLTRLKEMARNGMSSGQMAKAIGHGTTRNVIIGQCKRHKIALLAKSETGQKPKKPTARDRQRTMKLQVKVTGPMEADDIAPVPAADAAIEAEEVLSRHGSGVTIFELNEHTCKFPLWHMHSHPTAEERVFCGAHAMEHSPYCEYHHRRAYTGIPAGKAKPNPGWAT